LEGKKLEITDKPVKVYNFKVDDFYTYHVAHIGVLVHNANNYNLKIVYIFMKWNIRGCRLSWKS